MTPFKTLAKINATHQALVLKKRGTVRTIKAATKRFSKDFEQRVAFKVRVLVFALLAEL